MDELDLLIDLHRSGRRQGPGSDDATRLAVRLAGLEASRGLKIADIGCGTGASTLLLARELEADVTAVDFLQPFLDDLTASAEKDGLNARIATLAVSMDALPFEEQSLDAIWSEGAIYNIGFEAGIAAWRRFLKPGAVLAVSELSWFTGERPAELERHWTEQYPEVATASAKLAALEANGYAPIGYFPLPEDCWLDNYYRPMQARFAAFLDRNGGSTAAQAIVEGEKREIALYERYSAYYGYGFYIARKIGA